ncbi:MAG: hypothetical protein V3V94_04340 [Candidatus Brocadiales bacterium]
MQTGGDLIIWAVLFLLLFGGSLIKAFFKWRAWQREEIQKPVAERESHSFFEELKKALKDVMVEGEGPVIVSEEEGEEPYRFRIERAEMGEEPPEPEGLPEAERGFERVHLGEISRQEDLHKKVPLSEVLPRNNLQRAVVMSEVLGPPRSKRRTHRLF